MNFVSQWRIPALPFVFRPLPSPDNPAGIPNHLPLHFAVQESTGRAAQVPDPVVAHALEAVYRCGSEMPGMMESQGIGREYAEDFLNVLRRSVGRPFIGLRVLEIGCGTGYLLHRLQHEGAVVTGIEPGHHPDRDSGGVNILRGFFPAAAADEEYDLILMYCLLEHLPDPAGFLRTVLERVAPGGMVCLAVPDAGGFLGRGDVSMLFSEHYSYFTADSLHRTLAEAGGRGIRVQRSSFTALLHATCGREPAGTNEPAISQAEPGLTNGFRRRAENFLEIFQRQLEASRACGREVGLYAAGRAVNVLALTGASLERLRFFDDCAMLHGTYFPGLPITVENRDDFQRRPPDEVIIMSVSFGARIEAALRPLAPARVQFRQLEAVCP